MLYKTNTISVSSEVMITHLPELLPPQRLAAMTSIEYAATTVLYSRRPESCFDTRSSWRSLHASIVPLHRPRQILHCAANGRRLAVSPGLTRCREHSEAVRSTGSADPRPCRMRHCVSAHDARKVTKDGSRLPEGSAPKPGADFVLLIYLAFSR